jgi:tetratricopeptide (TPR) repeat protein
LTSLGAGLARIHATWAVEIADSGDKPVKIEAAGDDGRFTPVGAGTSKGSLDIPVPIPAQATRLQVRFTASDKAGNQVSSTPVMVDLTQPQITNDARRDIAKAVSSLPSLAEVNKPKNPPDVAKAPVAPVTTKPLPPPAKAPAVVAATPIPTPPDASTTPASAGPTTDAVIPSPPVPAPVEDGLRPMPLRLPYISGSDADDLLREARVAVQFKRFEDALDFYDRVLSSSRAVDGAHDMTRLLNRLKRPKDLCTVVSSLPPEYLDDTVRLEHGRALANLGRHSEAVKTLERIGDHSSESREAYLLIALSWRVLGRGADAVPLLKRLAQGDDNIARKAQDLLASPR